MRSRAEIERALARQALIHHRKHEEQLERVLADLIAVASRKRCKCEAARTLRHLGEELGGHDGDKDARH